MAPFLERLGGGFRKPEIDGPREELLGAIDAARRQQFLRADDAHRVALLGAEQVLAAFAARQRQIARADVAPLGEVSQQRRVLVVGVRRDHQCASQYAQFVQAGFDIVRASQIRLCPQAG